MMVSNALYPTGEQFDALLKSDLSGPVSMVNLLKFRRKAVYDDGRITDLNGKQAYDLYGTQMQAYVQSKGGRFLYYGQASHMVIGSVEDPWDTIAIVEYPSKEAFVTIASAPEVAEFAIHRSAGLEGQLLIATSGGVA